MVRRSRSASKQTGKTRTVTAPRARAGVSGRVSKFPPVPFTGTERLVSLTPTADDGNAFIRSFEWNPGLASTFSVGHFQAQNFDKYMLGQNNMVSYTPACSTDTPGSVYILFDFDSNDPAPATELEFADNELTETCALYRSMSSRIDNNQVDTCRMLVRTGPSRTDKLLTDVCTVHIGAFGFTPNGASVAGTTLGHFHITYSAKLLVRQPLGTTVAPPRNTAIFEPVDAGAIISDVVLLQEDTDINDLGAVNDVGRIRLPPGWYEVHSRVGFRVPASGGLAPSGTFISLEIHLNGVRVDRSQSVIDRRFTAQESVQLSSTTLIQVGEGDLLTQEVIHDSDSILQLIEDRSILTIKLV